MKSFLRLVLAALACVFVVSGVTMMVQASAAKADVKAGIAAEKLVVPDDAQGYAGEPVNGPETLRAMADIIREHTLGATEGLVYSEMPREVPQLDESGQPVLDENGEPVMVSNAARAIWITSTTLQTALTQGYMAWKLADLVMGLGALFVLQGLGFGVLALKK